MGYATEPTPAIAADPDADDWLFTLGPRGLIEPGAAAYRGERFLVRGAARRLLCLLVRARGTAVPFRKLKASLGNRLMTDSGLRRHAHDLREVLRAALAGLEGFPANPVPCADRGPAGGYRLAV